MSRLVRRQSSAQNWSHDSRIDVIWQKGKVARVQSDVLLKAAVLMVQVIRAFHAVLLRSGQTELAAPADPTCESDAHETAELDVVATARSQCDDLSDSLVPADVREFDVCYRVAVRPRSSPGLGM